MIKHNEISDNKLHFLLKQNIISYGGNIQLKIYGRLNCSSGKRMKKENRVFFYTKKEALENGFRPCGHCLSDEYKKWKNDKSFTL